VSFAIAVPVLFATSAGPGHAHREPRAPTSASTVVGSQRRSTSGHDTRGAQDRAIDRLLARQPFISAGGSERREIALTFDDGPGPYTPLLLDQLQRLHVAATFF